MDIAFAWNVLRAEAEELAAREPLLAPLARRLVLERRDLADAIAELLAGKLAGGDLDGPALRTLFDATLAAQPGIAAAAVRDLAAATDRDPASHGLLNPFANHKGFQALQAQRLSHALWAQGRRFLALHLQGLASRAFAVDIHPAARMGAGIFIDHGTGVVIGETAVVEDDVSMLQGVTLGGTGKETGDRHPKIGRGVLLSADATVLGNIRIGEGAKVGAGSVVLQDVPPHATVVGVPGRVVGTVHGVDPALTMDHGIQ